MRKILAAALSAMVCFVSFAQGGANSGMGYDEKDYASLAEKVLGLEKKSEAFNLYLNFSGAAGLTQDGDKWNSSLYSKHFRLEIKGDLTPRIYYRFRHHLDMSQASASLDNFAKATDMAFFGYRLTPKLDIVMGKGPLAWGGFEFDETPVYIYRYSEYVGAVDCFQAMAQIAYKPIPGHEFVFQVGNTSNYKFSDEFGGAVVRNTASLYDFTEVKEASLPFVYSLAWNGSLFSDRLLTRWSASYQNHAKDNGGFLLAMGQKLSLPRLQWYVDFYGEWDKMDRIMIASKDLFGEGKGVFAGDVRYLTLVTKLDWRFAPKWNLMVGGSFTGSGLRKIEELENYRTTVMYSTALEYYPVRDQDLRFFLSFMGRHTGFGKITGLTDQNANTFELGFIYRIKCY